MECMFYFQDFTSKMYSKPNKNWQCHYYELILWADLNYWSYGLIIHVGFTEFTMVRFYGLSPWNESIDWKEFTKELTISIDSSRLNGLNLWMNFMNFDSTL